MKFGFGSSTEKNGVPRIEGVNHTAAIPGGEMVIRGSGLAPRVGPRPSVHFGEADAGLMLVTENRVIVRVPVTPDHEHIPPIGRKFHLGADRQQDFGRHVTEG